MVQRNAVEWAIRNKGIPETLVTVVMSLYKGAGAKVKVVKHFSEEFEVNAGIHQRLVLSPLLFAIVVNVITNEINEGILHKIFYEEDIALIAESLAELEEKFYSWKSALETIGLMVNPIKTKVMVSKIGQVTVKPSIKKDPCGICGNKQC